METNINNLEYIEFWEKVKEEYGGKRHGDHLLCYTSPCFRFAWNYCRYELRDLSILFMKENNYHNFEVVGFTFLFESTTHSSSLDDKVSIRKAFIDWNIERLKSK